MEPLIFTLSVLLLPVSSSFHTVLSRLAQMNRCQNDENAYHDDAIPLHLVPERGKKHHIDPIENYEDPNNQPLNKYGSHHNPIPSLSVIVLHACIIKCISQKIAERSSSRKHVKKRNEKKKI